ncbi:MAG: DUF4351 domain-containing protein [Acidobacteriota bacterium]|nr:DUF4351 domain-containing protein [Acidobacteriota bacterium]
MIDHDQLFKELLRACFAEFIKAFLPDVYTYLDTRSVEFIEQESADETTQHEKLAVDILVKARFKGRLTCFLIHVEAQASKKRWSGRRMFIYFAAQSNKHDLPLYPIALFSWDRPRKAEPSQYVVDFPNRRVLEFNYDVIQLNRLDWRDFLKSNNPVAIALMAKMNVEPKEFPTVKAACLRLLSGQKLPERKLRPIRRFIDAYLPLTTPQRQKEFEEEINRLSLQERKKIMEYLTPTEREGFNRGLIEGKIEGKIELALKQLSKKLGELSKTIQRKLRKLTDDQVDELALALFEFQTKAELNRWLKERTSQVRLSNRSSQTSQ